MITGDRETYFLVKLKAAYQTLLSNAIAFTKENDLPLGVISITSGGASG